MTRPFALSLVLASLLGLSACVGGETHESLAKESIAVMTDIGKTLAKVTDKASAEKQSGELKKLADKMDSLQKRMEELGPPSEEAGQALEKKLEEDMGAAMATMTSEMMRLAGNAEVQAVLEPIFEKIGQ